ncbi:hypothetical protein BELL_0101g00090 [Botrytis elliptica]|uniref:Uncharacterized protein n=1 Tax=Botrytis elliptica TaxID=278938 RepID=A0A4Z1JWJ9_9HELO|nr:hypothetical protein EAE99_008314 [Botrytis elliptica]TGO77564.1 hypothetical protein BELL_0101g00090 [Botrytis elliptica]
MTSISPPARSGKFAQKVEKQFVEEIEDGMVLFHQMTSDERTHQGSDSQGKVILRQDIIHAYSNMKGMAGVRLATMLDGGGIDILLIMILNEIGCSNAFGKFYFYSDPYPPSPKSVVKPVDLAYRNEIWSPAEIASFWSSTPEERASLYLAEHISAQRPIVGMQIFYCDDSPNELRLPDRPLAAVILLFRSMRPYVIRKEDFVQRCWKEGKMDARSRITFKMTPANSAWLDGCLAPDMVTVQSTLASMCRRSLLGSFTTSSAVSAATSFKEKDI